jgi:hypothetical protein
MTQADNIAGLAALNRELLATAEAINCPRRVVLDVNSTEIPVHGEQEQNAYNGHFESTCYHPLLLFNREAALPPRSAPATSTPPRAGKNCCCLRLIGNSGRARR